ncbi:MAG: zinc ribbon domain-containing protein [Spirochaetales bacterium]|jgi:rubrerythrin|nr:zinc ribbon domain-containing protein [Spirochaetales bacterium]
MKNSQRAFFCENCGGRVRASASTCPRCGASFAGVRCPGCGYRGQEKDFLRGCPSCGYQGAPRGKPEKTLFLPRWVWTAAVCLLSAFLVLSLVLLLRRV